jgi:hypothetical protein
MRAAITADLVRNLPEAPCEIWDTKFPGLVLRIRESGRASYVVVYGRGKKETLGRADALTPAEARKLARGVIGDISHGRDPQAERRKRQAGTLREFLDGKYAPWAEANRKTGGQTVTRISRAFPDALLNRPIADLTSFQLEQWRTKRRKAGRLDTTINRDLDALRAVPQKPSSGD